MKVCDIDRLLEDYGTGPVPSSKTRNWFQIGLVIWGIVICIPAFMLGGLLGSGASLKDIVLAVLIGATILTVISIMTGVVGAQTRLSTAMIAKFVFGRHGAIILALILAVTSFGWFGIQLEVFGRSLCGAVDVVSVGSFSVPRPLVMAVGGALMTSTAIIGFRAIAELSYIVVPALLVILVVALVKAAAGTSIADVLALPPRSPLPMGVLISAVVGAMAVGAVIMPDVTRYCRGRGHAALGTAFGMIIGFPLVIIMSAYLSLVAVSADFSAVMLAFHSGVWGFLSLLTIVFATWTTNDNNLYSFALDLGSIFPAVPKWLLTAAGGALGTVFALFGILENFLEWLMVLAIVITPVGAVLAVDLLFSRNLHVRYKTTEGIPPFRPLACISWACGVLVGILSYLEVLSLTKIPALDSMITAFVVYSLAQRSPLGVKHANLLI